MEELLKEQKRQITKVTYGSKDENGHETVEPNPELGLKYRNELLKIYIPILLDEAKTTQNQASPLVQNNILINGENVKLDVDITKTLAYYRQALDNANRHNLRSNDTLKQVDTSESQAAST